MAMWNAPFLNGPSRGVAERVPSGAMTSEMPLVADLVDRGLQRLLGLLGVAAVDERDARELEELPEARDVLGLLLGDAGEAAAQQLHHDDRVELALVVEDEHARPCGPQVLVAADDVDVDAGEREAEVGADAAGDLQQRVARAVQQRQARGPPPNAARKRAVEAAVRAMSGSPGDRRAARSRSTGQPPLGAPRSSPSSGVDGDGVPTARQERDVLGAVGVGERARRGRCPARRPARAPRRALPPRPQGRRRRSGR